ncbi:MAG: hypothetical protein WBB28_01635 [Crinalium sp.]
MPNTAIARTPSMIRIVEGFAYEYQLSTDSYVDCQLNPIISFPGSAVREALIDPGNPDYIANEGVMENGVHFAVQSWMAEGDAPGWPS